MHHKGAETLTKFKVQHTGHLHKIFRTVDTREKEQKSIIIYELQELYFMFYVCACVVSKALQEPILVSEHHHVDK